MDINAVKAYMNQWMEENKQEFYTAADEIWAHPELGLEETRAFGILTGLLKKYGFAVESGTIQYIAKVVLYWVRNVPWLIPVVYLGLNFALSAIGVSPPAVNMFLFPIFMTLCYATQTSELFLTVGANAGGMSGTLSSLGMVGIMLAGMISSSGLEIDIQGTVMHVFLNATKAFFILYAIYYVVLRLYRIQSSHYFHLYSLPLCPLNFPDLLSQPDHCRPQ